MIMGLPLLTDMAVAKGSAVYGTPAQHIDSDFIGGKAYSSHR